MYEIAKGDVFFYTFLEIAILILGAAMGALIGALILKLGTRLVAGFWPGYWKSYRAVVFAGAATLVLHYAFAKACIYFDIFIWHLVFSLLSGFFIHILLFRLMIENETQIAFGWMKTTAVSLIQSAFYALAIFGVSVIEREFASGDEGFFLPILRTVFNIRQTPWRSRIVFVLAGVVVFALVHIMVLMRRRVESSWLSSTVTALSLIPYGFGFVFIANQILAGMWDPTPKDGFDLLVPVNSLIVNSRQTALWTSCIVILILISGRMAVRLRRHRQLTAMRMGPSVPAFFWVLGLPLLAVTVSFFLDFYLQQLIMGTLTNSAAGAGVASEVLIRGLTVMHFLGLFIVTAGVVLTAVAYWRAGRGLGKAPWALYASILFLLILSGVNIFYSLYCFSVFKAN